VRIALNLATRPYADLGPAMRRLRIGVGALAALCLALALGLHAVHNKAEAARAREHSLDGQLARVNAERQGYTRMMQQPDNASLLRQAATLNQIFDEKTFSWTLAMENLETVVPGGVQVTMLEPTRDKTGQITLHLRVVGPRDLALDMVRNLEHSKRFLQPRIVGENAESASSGPNRPAEPVSATNRFNFDILSEYNPPSPDEVKASKGAKTQGAVRQPGQPGNEPTGAPASTPANQHRGPRFQTNAPAPLHRPRTQPVLQNIQPKTADFPNVPNRNGGPQ
jgi:type IV pilus assembly protein PilN